MKRLIKTAILGMALAGAMPCNAKGDDEIGADMCETAGIVMPEDAVAGDFDGDGVIEHVWITGEREDDEFGAYATRPTLRSDNPKFNGLSWEEGLSLVRLTNEGRLGSGRKDYLGVVPCPIAGCWHGFELYAFTASGWKEAIPSFIIYDDYEDDVKRVVKDPRRPGYVITLGNKMDADPDHFAEEIRKSVKLHY